MDQGHDHESLPLKGAVLCCTSLPQDVRAEFANYATEMGAVHNLDLTSEVTHLVVGDIATAKYRYTAKERPDIIVLTPDWIQEVRRRWMSGEVVDVEALEKLHRLPTFYRLKICVTGFQDEQTRTMLETTAKKEGAEYHGDLTKQVTHLVALAPEGAKYKFAKQWGLHVVTLKWFKDSLERGMALDEALYDPLTPIEEQGKGAFRRQTSLGKRNRRALDTADDLSKRKLRRTASTRLHSQSQDLWNDIAIQGPVAEGSGADQWAEDPEQTSSKSMGADSRTKDAAVEPDKSTHHQRADGLFAGTYVMIHGFNQSRTSRLCEHLTPNGASVATDAATLSLASQQPGFRARYLLVPHALGNLSSEQLPDVPDDTLVVSEWWLERCIDRKAMLEPEQDVLCRPFWHINDKALADVTFCTTGFLSLDFRQIVEAMRLHGAAYKTHLEPSVTVLVSASSKQLKPEKALYASKHQITVVSVNWIWACLSSGRREPFEAFLLSLPRYQPSASVRNSSTTNLESSESLNEAQQSGKLAGNKGGAAVRLSSTKSRNTPSLSLQLSAKPSETGASEGRQPNVPFILEDDDSDDDDHDDDDATCDTNLMCASARSTATTQPLPTSERHHSIRDEVSPPTLSAQEQLPLGERSPNVSPPKKDDVQGDRRNSGSGVKEGSMPKEDEGSENQRDSGGQDEFAADLVSILRRAASRSDRPESEEARFSRRKRQPLGRNLSGTGIGVAYGTSSAVSNRASPVTFADDGCEGIDPGEGSRIRSRDTGLPEGTQLGYENADAEAQRRQMADRQGGLVTISDSGRARAGGRAIARQRRNKT